MTEEISVLNYHTVELRTLKNGVVVARKVLKTTPVEEEARAAYDLAAALLEGQIK